MITEKIKYFRILFIASLCLISFFVKIYFLGDVEPASDEAGYIYWVQTILQGQYFFPLQHENLNFFDSLKIDEQSIIHSILKPIYISGLNIFTLTSLIYFIFGSFILDASVNSQVYISIFANSLFVFFLSSCLFLFIKIRKKNIEILIISIFFFLFINFSALIYGFSTYGFHNVGILFFIINSISTENYLSKFQEGSVNFKEHIKFYSLQTFAIYSMYVNVFLIPTVFVLCILFSKTNIKKKLYEILKYSFFTIITLTPALIVFIFSLLYIDTGQSFIHWGKWAFKITAGEGTINNIFDYFIVNAQHWFYFNTINFGKISFCLSFLGLYILKNKYKIKILFLIPIAHLIVSIIVSGFNASWDRTGMYLLPFNSLGLAYIFYLSLKVSYQGFSKKIAIQKILIFPFILLITSKEIVKNFNMILNPSLIKTIVWSVRYNDENKDIWKNILSSINNKIPKNSYIITSHNAERTLLSIFDYPKKKLNYLGSLDSLENSLRSFNRIIYKKKLKKAISENPNIYLIVFNKKKQEKSKKNNLKRILCELNEVYCIKKLVIFDNIKSETNIWNEISIYSLE